MDINRYTEKLQEAIRAAQTKARRYGHQQIDVAHLLLALLEQEGVLIHPGHFFDFPGAGYLVASLIAPEEDFREGMRRVLRALDETD